MWVLASDSIYWWDFYCLFAIDERPDVAIHKIERIVNLISCGCCESHSVYRVSWRRNTGIGRYVNWEKFPLRNCNNHFRCEMHLTVKMCGAALMQYSDGCYHNIKWDNNAACWWHWIECIVAYTVIVAQWIQYYRRHAMQTEQWLWKAENAFYVIWITLNQQSNIHNRSIRLKCQYDGTN